MITFKMQNGNFYLEELISKEGFALFDTNILVGPLHRLNDESTKKQKLIYIQENLKFYDELIISLEEGFNFFITDGVFTEYSTFMPSRRRFKDGGPELEIVKELLTKGRRELARAFEENDKIFEVQNEQENDLYLNLKKYSGSLKSSFGVSEVDMDLLFSAAVISNTRGPTALISNDFGIYHAWHLLKEKGHFSQEQLRYYIKKDFEGYQLLL